MEWIQIAQIRILEDDIIDYIQNILEIMSDSDVIIGKLLDAILNIQAEPKSPYRMFRWTPTTVLM
jgi:hypothetical protein